MNTIKAVDEYGRREGNVDLIEEYYKLHGSYKGFVEYLKDIYEENNN